MSAPPDEAFRGYANFRTYARGGPRGAPRAGGRCSSWRSHIAVILVVFYPKNISTVYKKPYKLLSEVAECKNGEVGEENARGSRVCARRNILIHVISFPTAACGAIFASYLDGWSLHALRALDLQPTPSGRSGHVNAASNGPNNANDFHGSVVNISSKNYSSYNGAAFNRSTENVFQYIHRSFEDIALDGLTLNSSAFNGHVFDSPTFDKLALNDSSNNIPVEDSVFNDPSFSDSAFNVPALYEELSNGTDSISYPLNKKGLNRHTYAEWALNYPVKNGTALNGRAENGSALDDRAKNGSALDDRAKNGCALNGTVLDNRTYKHFALNDGAYNSSAFNYHVGKDFSLNASLLSERDNGSVMYTILHDNGPALYDIGENGSVSNYRDENDLPLNNLSNNDSALNDHYFDDRGVKCATLNRPSLDDCDDNGSVLSSPSLDDRGDKSSDVNDLYLIDREDNDSAESSPSVKDYGDNRPASTTRGDNGHVFNGPADPALHGHTGNRPFFNMGGATGTSKGSTTHAGALDGFWSFHPTLLHAMMPVGSALAAWAFGRGADRLGRRFALLACGLVGALAWLLLLCERSSVQWVCASRILVGVQMGAIFTVFPVYVAEIAHVRLCPARRSKVV
ncbi:Uncharacterized protein GBIM_11031 [Gryllus bimaculatus]|nr:Uncharacterized protein GBIM_11031 [Gryllus bimaculatus]